MSRHSSRRSSTSQTHGDGLFYNQSRHRKMTLDPLSLFGLFAVAAALVSYALEDRGPWWIFAFAIACVLSSIYGFLQGAWPFGVVEIAWTIVALRRWWKALQPG